MQRLGAVADKRTMDATKLPTTKLPTTPSTGPNPGGSSARRRVRARPIHKGTRYKITRRCLERRFFLVPSPEINEQIGYWLAVCLEEHGIQLHAACFMSNHYHLDVTDVGGNLPAFKNHFNATLARLVNSTRGRFDKFWAEDRPSDVRLLEDDDVIEKMAYTLANPTSAGLVKWGRRWPGLTTYSMGFGDSLDFEKPKTFFDPNNNSLPQTALLRLVRPAIELELSDDELHGKLMVEVRRREVEMQREMRAKGRRFLGECRILRQKWNLSSRSREKRFELNPTFASKNKWARIAQVQRDRDWEARYAAAMDALLGGARDVLFPAGSYWMRLFAGARVSAAD